MKLLVIEENHLIGHRIREVLASPEHAEHHEYDVTIITDSGAAYAHLSKVHYDVIIAPWRSSHSGGVALYQRLKPLFHARSPVAFLMVMTQDTPSNREQAHQEGVTACLSYPLSLEELLYALKHIQQHFGEVAVPPQENEHPAITSAGEPLGSRERLGEILIRRGRITQEQLGEALEVQSLTQERLGSILVGRGWVTERDIAAAHSRQIDMTFVNVESEPVFAEGIATIPREQALALLFLPLEPFDEDAHLLDPPIRVAIANPWNTPAIDLVQSRTQRRVRAVLAESAALTRAIEFAYQHNTRSFENYQLTRSMEQTLLVLNEEVVLSPEEQQRLNQDDDAVASLDDPTEAPVVKLVNMILIDAARRGASDIHLEPYKKDFEVRYRIDGHLHVIHTLSKSSYPALISRLKILSDLDIAERRVPQDGRINLSIDGRTIQFRVSTLPNLYGERLVMRILDSGRQQKSIDQLELSISNLEAFYQLIQRPYGIFLVTGPTGSGKTTTLYSALSALQDTGTNIMTCEDPIEYEMDRISQSMVHPKAGLTFASQLRAILRQDPDIILVGEMRDQETAEIAFRAAMTGHLVLSTLHCNHASSAPSRLMDMGVEPFLISSGLIGVLAQRLVRKLCVHCSVLAEPTSAQQGLLEHLLGSPFAKRVIGHAVGCARCGHLGTQGRVGVHELMVVTESLQQWIVDRTASSGLQAIAEREGMVPLLRDGLEKVFAGQVLLEDVRKKIYAG